MYFDYQIYVCRALLNGKCLCVCVCLYRINAYLYEGACREVAFKTVTILQFLFFSKKIQNKTSYSK